MKICGQLKPGSSGPIEVRIEFPLPFAEAPLYRFALEHGADPMAEVSPIALAAYVTGWATRPLNDPPGEYVGDVWIGAHVLAEVVGAGDRRCIVHYEFDGPAGDPT